MNQPNHASSSFPSLDVLIPHRLPMRFIEELISWSEKEAVCKAIVRASIPFVKDGRISTAISLEYFAQTAAAWFGYKAFVDHKPFELGVLCGARVLTLQTHELCVGDEVYCYAQNVWSDERLAQFTCRLECKHQEVAQASISVMQGMKELQR